MNKYNIILIVFLSILFLRFGLWVLKSKRANKHDGSKGNWTYFQKHKILSKIDDTITKTFEKICPTKVICEKNCFINNIISNNSYTDIDKNGINDKQTKDIVNKCAQHCNCDL
jgi:hypothetical protein